MTSQTHLAALILACAMTVAALQGAWAGNVAQVWVSSLDMETTLAQKKPLTFVKRRPSNLPSIAIEPYLPGQSILGIGASFEHATCYNVSRLDPAKRAEVLDRLVNPESGIGMNLMRICIGTSDFVGEPWYSYDDIPPGETDPMLEHFSIAKDRAYVLPVLKTALEKNPGLRFFASPWSPPGWMKNSGSMCGGRLLPEYYGVYAQYLCRFIKAYEAEGIPVYALTVQNEPGVSTPAYPSCWWNGLEQCDFIKNHLGPALKENALVTRIWCFDHNFNNTKFPKMILRDPEAAQYVDGTAFHCYEGKPTAMSGFAKMFPENPVYFTEGSTYGVRGAIQIMEFFRHMAGTYNAWVTIIDDNGKPNNGPHHCDPTCIVLHSDSLALEYRFDYYMYGHFAKFVKRGAVRLRSEKGDLRFSNVAFRNPDRTIVLVVANDKPEEIAFKIQWKDSMILTTLGPKSVATYTWPQNVEAD